MLLVLVERVWLAADVLGLDSTITSTSVTPATREVLQILKKIIGEKMRSTLCKQNIIYMHAKYEKNLIISIERIVSNK